MNSLKNKTALVTGGSRGIGRGIVEALASEGANVWALARDTGNLDALKRDVKGVQTLAADIADPQTASEALGKIHPDILVLDAGATPSVAPVYELTWEQFNHVWETDVKATFFFGKEALLRPLARGSVVIVISSGAAYGRALRSGSYAAAKRAQWLLAQHLQEEADKLNLGIRFIVLIPRQIVGTTELGHNAATRYAALEGISKEQYLERLGTPPLTPEIIGQGVVSLLTNEAYHEGMAFEINSQGLSVVS